MSLHKTIEKPAHLKEDVCCMSLHKNHSTPTSDIDTPKQCSRSCSICWPWDT